MANRHGVDCEVTMRQDADLDMKETIRISVAVLIVLFVLVCGVAQEMKLIELLGGLLVCLVIVVPFLVIGHVRDGRLRRERETVRRQCEAMRASGGQCDWSKAQGGTLRYPEPYLDHGIRKPYHTGRIKEAHKPPSADSP